MANDLKQEKLEAFWQRFLTQRQLTPNLRFQSAYQFDLTEHTANALLQLVLQDVKKATCSSLASFQINQEPIPQVGDYNIITDWAGTPKCIVQNSKVSLLAFREMTFELCAKEGEDDCLASWQLNHQRFFRAEGKAMGYEFQEEMTVVFEEFQVVYRVE